jgi:hypothetical protein
MERDSLLLLLICLVAVVAPRSASAEYGGWYSTSFGAYLAPTSGFVGADGGVDVVVHFHGARLAEHEWRATELGAVVVDADFGGASTAFYEAMDRPERFGEMLDEVLERLRARTGIPELHLRRVALLSWSAGYAAVARVLAQPRYVDRVDAVMLLDSLHAPYVEDAPKGASEHGIPSHHIVDRRALAPFIDFGRLAAQGKKLLVVTHSDILPPDYGSTTETAFTLTVAIDARLEPATGRTARGMWRSDSSDSRGYHMRGFWGATPETHIEHLHLLDDVVREFLVPRWTPR